VMAAILILFTWQQVSTATKQLIETKQTLSATNEKLLAANSQFSQTQAQYSALQTKLATTNQDIAVLKSQAEKYQQEIGTLSADVEKYKSEVGTLLTERDGLQKAISELGAQIEAAQGLKRYLYTGDINLVLKSMVDQKNFELLLDIWGMQGGSKTWQPGGIGPDQFDSPGFAVYILNKYKAVEGDPEKIHYSLISMLPSVTSPSDGDIVIYEGGFTMFYFMDGHTGVPFVIGMTPLGIVALKYDFAKVRLIGHVVYP
jgi:hypothetical protein